jgi:hypothetical protein
MTVGFICHASGNIIKGFGNILLNGFDTDLSREDKVEQVGITFADFKPINRWHSYDNFYCNDGISNRIYFDDSTTILRLKCAALIAATPFIQPIGLALNLINRIAKIVAFAHLWKPSNQQYNFIARFSEWAKDIAIVVLTPFILIGLLFSALYGTTLSPQDGRKLYATLERLAYSGGYQFFGNDFGYRPMQNNLLAPCFQPSPQSHLGGSELKPNVW